MALSPRLHGKLRAFASPPPDPSLTFAELAEIEVKRREKKGQRTTDLRSALRKHLLPVFGEVPASELNQEAFIAFANYLRIEHQLGTNRIRNLILFARWILRDVLSPNPARLPHGLLLSARPDEFELSKLVFTCIEMNRIISAERIPLERRVLYALLLLTGMRFGEAAAIRWKSWVPNKPLDEIIVRETWDSRERVLIPRTKTGAVCYVPVHSRLRAILISATRDFRQRFGRSPTGDDLISPDEQNAEPVFRQYGRARRMWIDDLIDLDIRPRGLHRTRHTFVSRLLSAGAPESVARQLTHPPVPKRTYDAYTHFDWADRCKAVALLKLPRGRNGSGSR